jgi:glutathione S-transferase
MALDFYHGHGSPFSWRVWLALELKQVPYNLKLLSFQAGDTRKPEFVALSPRGHVPTIVDGDFVLWESIPIVEYLDERYNSGTKLFPGDAQARSRIRRLAREAEAYLGIEGIDPIVDKARARVKEELEHFAKELRGAYLTGDAITAADIVLYPLIGYVNRITVRRPESKLAELVPAPIREWAKRIESLPFFDQTFPAHWR